MFRPTVGTSIRMKRIRPRSPTIRKSPGAARSDDLRDSAMDVAMGKEQDKAVGAIIRGGTGGAAHAGRPNSRPRPRFGKPQALKHWVSKESALGQKLTLSGPGACVLKRVR